MKNTINGVTEVLTIEDLPRQVRQVIPGKEDYIDAAWCPSCAALFRKGTPNWGREICGHCGQLLEWPEEK